MLRRGDGTLVVDKTLTTPAALLEGFFAGVHGVLRKAGIAPAEVDGFVVHATTVVTNALIERRVAPAGMLVTEGFRDVLAIRNEHRYEMYDPQIEFAPPLVPRELTFGVRERTLADGSVLVPPELEGVRAVAADLVRRGVGSVAVCLLNSYANPANERAVRGALLEAAPGLMVSLSSEIAPQIREYPRASTTAINAYTMPVSQPYLQALAERLRAEGFPNAPLIMLSSGGIIGADVAGRHPVRMIESGPAAGALAASHYAERLGIARLLSFDMGGTTAKACLIDGGKPLVTGMLEVDRKYRFKEGSGMPVTIPSIDMIEIGAGGGSLAGVDDLGLLKVGPHSAGAVPGPVCYGRGGTQPAVTDADLVLGLLDADNVLGGDMRLDRDAAERAIAGLGERLGTGLHETARGIFRIVAEAMAAAARTHVSDRGLDYRGLPLLAFGGAGPVHACEVAALLHGETVIFPPNASVLSAFGTLVTPLRLDLVRSDLRKLDDIDWARLDALLGEMVDEGDAALRAAGCTEEDISHRYGADLRYFGQQNEVSVDFSADPRGGRSVPGIRAAFELAYLAQYGFNPGHVPVEVVNWRVTAHGPVPAPAAPPRMPATPARPKGTRPVYLWVAERDAKQGWDVPVYDRDALAQGQAIDGPAIIEERETTVVLPPQWRAIVEPGGCIVAQRNFGGA